MKNFIANKRGQSLSAHCVLVGRLAEDIVTQMYGKSNFSLQTGSEGEVKVAQMKRVAKVAGLLHDIGKVDQEFQSYMRTVQHGSVSAAATSEDGTHIDDGFEKKRFSFEDYAGLQRCCANACTKSAWCAPYAGLQRAIVTTYLHADECAPYAGLQRVQRSLGFWCFSCAPYAGLQSQAAEYEQLVRRCAPYAGLQSTGALPRPTYPGCAPYAGLQSVRCP